MKNIKKVLKDAFGFNSFKEGQEEIVKSIVSKNDTLVFMPTGWGKSLTYQLPGLMREWLTIVISPLISLMKDQVDALKKRNIPADFINSTLSKSKREKRLQNFVEGKIKLLYVTPERFRKSARIRVLTV